MKKILYITTLSRTINAFLVPHIEMLMDKGNKVDCACCIDKPIDKNLKNKGINVFDIPFTRNPLDIKNVKAFKKLIRIQEEKQYDIVHVHTPIASVYGRLLKLKFPKLKIIYTAHGFHFYKGAPMLNWIVYYPIERIMANFTDVIVTMNDEDYNRSVGFNIPNTYKINGVGLDLDKYNPCKFNKYEVRKKLGLNQDDFLILMIAEVNKNKNHIQMIKAIEILKHRGVEVKVLCAGDGPLLQNIKVEIKNRNLESNIFMLGYRNDISEIITACDIGLALSYREGLPRNIMEFLAYGKPVIGSNIRGIKDIIKNGENGYLVNLGDATDTSNKIEKIYINNRIYKYMSEKSYKISKSYDIKNIINDIEEFVYRD